MILGRLGPWLVASAMLAGGPRLVAEPAPDAATAPVSAVLESFRVGDEVYVRSLAVDERNGSLWVGTSTGALEIDLDSRNVRNIFTRKDGLANEYVFAIHCDQRGGTWFGTNAGGVSRYRDGQWDVYFPMHGLADYWVYAFAEHEDGTLWIGTWAGVNRVDGAGRFETFLEELVNEWVYAIDIDSGDRVWFGTEGGISRYDGESWRHWTHEQGLGAPNAMDLPASPNTGLGTRSRHDLGVHLEGGPTYNPNYVFSLIVDEHDIVWAGTWGGGLSRYDGDSWSNFTVEDGLAGNIVYSIAVDAAGVLWLGTNGGLSRYDGETWSTYGRREGLLGDDVYTVVAAPGGDIWAGTRGGVSRLGIGD